MVIQPVYHALTDRLLTCESSTFLECYSGKYTGSRNLAQESGGRKRGLLLRLRADGLKVVGKVINNITT